MFTNPPSVIITAPSIQYFKQNSEDPLLRVSWDLRPVYLLLQSFKERENREVGGVAGSPHSLLGPQSAARPAVKIKRLRCPRSILCRPFRWGSKRLSSLSVFVVFQRKTMSSTNILGAYLAVSLSYHVFLLFILWVLRVKLCCFSKLMNI